MPLQIRKEDIDIAKNMLKVIEFEQSADNLRTRYVYKSEDVKFEIDEYSRPQMNIVGIEGKKDKVDKIYTELKQNPKLNGFIIE